MGLIRELFWRLLQLCAMLDEVDLSSGFDCLVFRGSDALLHQRMRTVGRQRGIFCRLQGRLLEIQMSGIRDQRSQSMRCTHHLRNERFAILCIDPRVRLFLIAFLMRSFSISEL
jgi:hypothetical protein